MALPPPPPPVHWSATAPAKPPAPNSRFTVILNAQIDPGWHLYALQEPEGGPFPTEIALAASDPADLLSVDQSTPRNAPDPVFGKPIPLFVASARFTLHLKLPAGPVQSPLHILVRYQSCNDQVCLPPHTETVELPLK